MYAIRRATVEDAPTLSALAARTFTETFGHLYRSEDLQHFLQTSYDVQRQRVILQHPDYAVWLLELDGVAIGHAAAGPCGLPHPQAQASDGELKRLYLVKAQQSCGWGSRLLETALAWLERDGPRTLWLGVWSANFGAQRFYARYGFEKVGEYLFPVGESKDLEFIMRRTPRAD
ncbi:GNAT family N-acetyltransferase [Stenotrophomonas sp. C3(2023)]|uniref:GNAT family N-acetyltransferase n=1 Tax=Stenotrophomonas sp. C3(2023) TaxID=3080277 RepID=UPI00293CAE75|nr:GNAT family N-acetyltransferase [Stenotrophomonas sp. C3(2023)]MDV3467832.1 GNAT family N-acetyltransferase [Stenotrophomonas sp. C3(2023)]